MKTAVEEAEATAPSRRDRRRAASRRRTPLLLQIAGWVVFAVVMALVALVLVIPRLTGAVPLAVLTSSMEPTMPPGTLVVSQPTDAAALAIGDVVTFQPVSDDPLLITHRIVAVSHQADGDLLFTTRGDNNGADDEPIVAAQVMGKVVYSVPWAGYATTLFSGAERGWVVGALGGILLGYAVLILVREVLRRRRRT